MRIVFSFALLFYSIGVLGTTVAIVVPGFGINGWVKQQWRLYVTNPEQRKHYRPRIAPHDDPNISVG